MPSRDMVVYASQSQYVRSPAYWTKEAYDCPSSQPRVQMLVQEYVIAGDILMYHVLRMHVSKRVSHLSDPPRLGLELFDLGKFRCLRVVGYRVWSQWHSRTRGTKG